jgi:hypothetical protein
MISPLAANGRDGSDSTELAEAIRPSMSAVAPIATDLMPRNELTRSARSRREQMQHRARTEPCLFDHLVGEQLNRVGHLDAELPGRLQVDDELEFG